MYNLDDKELDRLSKAAAENYEAPGMASWEAMERTLDVALPQEEKKKRRGFFLFFLLAGCLAGISIWYATQKNNTSIENKTSVKTGLTTTENHSNTNQSGEPTPGNNPAGAVSSKNKTSNPEATSQPAANSTASIVPGTTDKSNIQAAGSDNSVKSVAAPLTLIEKAPSENKNRDSNARQLLLAKERPVRQAPVAGFKSLDKMKNILSLRSTEQIAGFHPTALHAKKQKAGKLKAEKLSGQKDDVSKTNKHIKTKTETGIAEDPSTASAEIPAGTVDENFTNHQPGIKDNNNTSLDSGNTQGKTVTNKIPKKEPLTDTTKATVIKSKDSKKEKAILAGLTGGFDYSTVRFTYGDKTGYNIGAIAGYQFNKHWSVITGAIFTRKNYHLKGSDYHPPKHSVASYLNIQSVKGYCNMWEVPLLARYTFSKQSHNNYFISAGISSYFMKQQKYNYDYITNGVSYDTTYAYNNTYNHVFSILHLSAGLEKKLGKHTGLLIEPYAKIPLGGVGYGNIRLSSFGINFSILLRQPLKH